MLLQEFDKELKQIAISNDRGHLYRIGFDEITGKLWFHNFENEKIIKED